MLRTSPFNPPGHGPHGGDDGMDALLAGNVEAGSALLVVTHDDVVGSRCSRQLRMLDGAVVSELAG